MGNIILHKRSSTPGTVPTSGALSQGELGINIADGKLYTKNSGNNIINLGVTSISGTSITPSSGNFSNYLAVNGVPVSVSGHSHTSVPQAQSLVTNVFNKTASTIPKFSVVYIDGGQGDQPTIQLAIADGESGSNKTYGITAEAISSMSAGSVIVAGALSGINTDQFNPTAPTGDVNGTTLWLSPTVSGSVTTTKPYAPNHAVFVGTIVRTHQNAGVVEVRVQNGYELEELHNVAVSGVSGGQFLYYNSSSGLWQPNANIYSSGSNIGIGTNTPSTKLHVDGDLLFEGGSLTFDGSTLNVAGLPNNDPLAWGDPGIITASIKNGPTTISLHSYTSNPNFEDGYWGGGVISLGTADSAGSTPTLTITPFGFVFGDSTVQNTAWTGSITSSQVTNFNSSVSGLLPTGTVNYIPKFGTGGSGLNNSVIYESGNNIGIGVTTPDAKLVVSGSLYTTDKLGVGGACRSTLTADLGATVGLAWSEGTFIGMQFQNTDAYRMGIVGVAGSRQTRILAKAADNAGIITFYPGAGTSEAGRFHSDGRFCIGTTTPSGQLHVAGLLQGNSVGTTGIIVSNSHASQSANGQNHTSLYVNPTFLTSSSNLNNTYGLLISPSSSGQYTTTNSYGLYVNASTLVTGTIVGNYAAVFMGGNVGVGTAAPSARLEVAASGTTSLDIAHFSNSNGVEKAKVSLSSAGDGTLSLIDASNNTDIFLTSNASTASYINAGNVGIGFTAPRAILDVSGVIRSTSYITSDTEFRLNNATFSRVATMDSAGAFAGGYNVYLSGSTPKHNSAGAISSYYYSSDGSVRFYTNSSQSADTNASERLRITSAGDVGIGTSSPSYKLDVAGDAEFGSNNWLKLIDTGSNNGRLVFSNVGSIDSAGAFLFRNNAGTTEYMRITTDGNVGIGTTSPTSKLHVAGDVLATGSFIAGSGSAANPSFEFVGDTDTGMFAPAANTIALATSGVERLRISNVGNVGIGTATPSEALHVAGNININGSIKHTVNASDISDNIAPITWYNTFNDVNSVIAKIDVSTEGSPSEGMLVFHTNDGSSLQERVRITDVGNVGIGTNSPGSPLTISAAGAAGTIGGASQTQIFQVNDASAADYINLGHFNCESNVSRGSFMLSNNGTNGAWQDNCLQFFTHGSSYGYGYYAGNLSDAGCAMIVTQGSDITKLQIGNYGSAPIEFFTSNAKKFGIEDNGNITIFDYIESDYTEGNYLVWNNTYNDTGPLAAIGLVTGDSSAEGTLVFHTGPANSTAERLKIDQNGNVGIGTIGNSITAKLEVVGNVNIDGNLTFDSFTESVVAIGNSSTSKTISLTSGTVQTCTLTDNCTFTMPTATAGKSFTLFLNSGAGNYTAIFTGVRWADSATPTATILANKVDIYSFISDGTYWYGSFSQNYG